MLKTKLPSFISLILAAASIALWVRCAHPASPIGGEKDIIPPEVVSSVPPNYSPNFKGKNISILFDEFVKLDKLQQQLLISPPVNEVPEIRLRGKTLLIKFLEDLKPETTYSVYFGDAIVDLSENNPIPGFTFVFSTGNVVDSMAITGQVRNAFDLTPAAETYVMLYLDDNDTIPVDSLPYQIRPYYLSRTTKEGFFKLQNLRNERFKIFALTDMNNNFMFDMPGESIAFLDSMIMPEYIKPIVKDTSIKADSLIMKPVADTLKKLAERLNGKKPADSLVKLTKNSCYLYLFNEVDSTQKLLRSELTKPGMLTFAFRYPAQDILVESMKPLPDSFQVLKFYSSKYDSLYWYFTQKVLDSLYVHVTRDSTINDTIELSLIPKAKPGNKKGAKKAIVTSNSLQFASPLRGPKLDLNKSLILKFEEPVVRYQMRDTNLFISNKDTLYNQVVFSKYDSVGLKYKLEAKFEAGGSYNLLVPDSVFFGFNGKTNDTIRLGFKVPTIEDYGNLLMEVKLDSASTVIFQLLGTKDIVLSQQTVNASGIVKFETLTPGKYKVKAIHDRNNNGQWDSGNYLKKIQPEGVQIFEKELEIRANWDFEEDWDLQGKFPDH